MAEIFIFMRPSILICCLFGAWAHDMLLVCIPGLEIETCAHTPFINRSMLSLIVLVQLDCLPFSVDNRWVLFFILLELVLSLFPPSSPSGN